MTLPPVLVITDRALVPGGDLLGALRAVVAAGGNQVGIAVAEEALSDGDRFALCEQVVGLARPAGALVLVVGRLDLARASDAHGLIGGALPAATVARCWPGGLRVARCADSAGAARAAASGVHGVILGPIGAGEGGPTPAGLEQLSGARSRIGETTPLLARGGIHPEHVPRVLAAGASGVVVSESVLADLAPGEALTALLRAKTQLSR